MTKEHTSEEIKYRLSDLGVQIGNIAIEYISKLEKQNKELREQLEQAKKLLKNYNNKATCCGEFMKNWTVQKLWEETNKFLNDENFESIEE